jgi:hypothetical protein
MNGILWEIKSPKSDSSRTIENNLRIALKQSSNLIIDLHRSKLNENKAIIQIKREFKLAAKIKNLLIISKNHTLLDLKR